MDTCANCKFSHEVRRLKKPDGGDLVLFQCRRHAPFCINTLAHYPGRAEWPHVTGRQWCGDFQSREGEVA